MILIDLVYINSSGGLTLSNFLLEHISSNQKKIKFHILLDKRNSKFLKINKLKNTIISKSELSRYIFYYKNRDNFNSIFCFGNVPPPIKFKGKTFTYFHNEILLNSKNLNFSLFQTLLFKLKWLYIKHKNSNYTWIVQTEHIKSLLSKKLKVNSDLILKYPLFKDLNIIDEDKIENSFIYPTSNHPHKNNEVLLDAFKDAAFKTNKKIILTLTLNKIQIDDLPKNLEINFTGLIKHEELITHMKNSKFLIFPSLRESFGLPLIEGVQSKCKIITSNLNFVKELINPSYIFDPNSKSSISEVITLALTNEKHPKSFIKINNSIELIFNKLDNV